MTTTREFRQVKFGRKLDVKRLLAALSKTMRELAKDPAPDAAPARLESVLIEKGQTTVHISGNRAGVTAVTKSLKQRYSKATVSKSSREKALALGESRVSPKRSRQ